MGVRAEKLLTYLRLRMVLLLTETFLASFSIAFEQEAGICVAFLSETPIRSRLAEIGGVEEIYLLELLLYSVFENHDHHQLF